MRPALALLLAAGFIAGTRAQGVIASIESLGPCPGANEERLSCATCEKNCGNANRMVPCAASCRINECACKNGFVRENGSDGAACIPVDMCPGANAADGAVGPVPIKSCEFWRAEKETTCGNCEPVCGASKSKCKCDNIPACQCFDGMVRGPNGQCIPENSCEVALSKTCQDPLKEFTECSAGGCGRMLNTCEQIYGPYKIACDMAPGCYPGCLCPIGYVYDDNGDCKPEKDCNRCYEGLTPEIKCNPDHTFQDIQTDVEGNYWCAIIPRFSGRALHESHKSSRKPKMSICEKMQKSQCAKDLMESVDTTPFEAVVSKSRACQELIKPQIPENKSGKCDQLIDFYSLAKLKAGTFIPQCAANGDFETVQKHPLTGFSTRDGRIWCAILNEYSSASLGKKFELYGKVNMRKMGKFCDETLRKSQCKADLEKKAIAAEPEMDLDLSSLVLNTPSCMKLHNGCTAYECFKKCKSYKASKNKSLKEFSPTCVTNKKYGLLQNWVDDGGIKWNWCSDGKNLMYRTKSHMTVLELSESQCRKLVKKSYFKKKKLSTKDKKKMCKAMDSKSVYTKCRACPQICGAALGACTKNCVEGCDCKKNYVRNAVGKCVKKKQCV